MPDGAVMRRALLLVAVLAAGCAAKAPVVTQVADARPHPTCSWLREYLRGTEYPEAENYNIAACTEGDETLTRDQAEERWRAEDVPPETPEVAMPAGALQRTMAQLIGATALALVPTHSEHTIGTGSGTIILHWDPNTETDLAGYVLVWGTMPSVYTRSVTLAASDNGSTLIGFEPGTTYFAIRAFNTATQQSAYSNEVVATFAGSNTPVVIKVRVPQLP